MDTKLKRLQAIQAEEAVIYEAEMEKKKIEIEFKMHKRVRRLKAEAALAERKAELMQEYNSDDLSSSNDENGSCRSTQLTNREQTELWAKSCTISDNQALGNVGSPERFEKHPSKTFKNT